MQDKRGNTALDYAENLKKMRKTAKCATKISILLLQEICQSKEKLKSKTEAQLDKFRGFPDAEVLLRSMIPTEYAEYMTRKLKLRVS